MFPVEKVFAEPCRTNTDTITITGTNIITGMTTMTGTNTSTTTQSRPAKGKPRPEELDAAGRSLSDALRISFAILKVIMVVLVVGFLASGFRTVETGEQGVVLRFGQIQRTEGPGWVWVFPYPIDELIRIPVDKRINLPVKTFWYKETREDIEGPGVIPRNYRAESLDPLQEGYCLTRSEDRESEAIPAVQLGPAANRSLALRSKATEATTASSTRNGRSTTRFRASISSSETSTSRRSSRARSTLM